MRVGTVERFRDVQVNQRGQWTNTSTAQFASTRLQQAVSNRGTVEQHWAVVTLVYPYMNARDEQVQLIVKRARIDE